MSNNSLRVSGLHNLPVETDLGEPLGKLTDVEINPTTHRVTRYLVKSHALLNPQHYIIAPEQVVTLSEEKMIVRDVVITETIVQPAIEPLAN